MYWLQQARSVTGNHIWTAVNEIYNLQSLSQARSVAGNHIWTAVNEIYNLQSLGQARSVAGNHIWTAVNEIYNLQSLSQARSAAIKDWLQQDPCQAEQTLTLGRPSKQAMPRNP
jgi:uncharacterized damage-inducible protein DinB